MLKAVIFDMDGVLLDSEVLHYKVIRQILEDLGADHPIEEFVARCGLPDYVMWPALLEKKGISEDSESLRKYAAVLDEEVPSPRGKKESWALRLERLHWKRFLDSIRADGADPFPGERQFLDALRAEGLRLAVASGSVAEAVHANLKALKIEDCFDAVITADDYRLGKPDPEVFLMAAERLGTAPQDCLVVEDSRNGLIAADRAGMGRVGFYGSVLPVDMELAPVSFCDYRQIKPEDFRRWHEETAGK